MKKNITKLLAVLVLICTLGTLLVACGNKDNDETKDPGNNETPAADYKLGMGVVVSLDSSKTGTAEVDATVATVVLDKDGKIVSCRLDVAQNKATLSLDDGTYTISENLPTKMEKGDAYGMANKTQGGDNNGDGVVKEWYEQAKAFEAYVVGKTAAQVEAMGTEALENGHVISTDEALLNAGCTISISEFKEAVVKACNDDQSVSFKTSGEFTLGVAANSYNDGSKAATAETDGSIKIYSDFAASVVQDGKILATVNDCIQPNIAYNVAGEIGTKTFNGTKRELKTGYGMEGKTNGGDNNGDGVVKEWYEQSAAFSSYVIGKTAAQVEALETQEVGEHVIAKDEALLNAGCTIGIDGIKAVVAESVTNAR